MPILLTYGQVTTNKIHIVFAVELGLSFAWPTVQSYGKVQTEITLSMMEAEYVALSTPCHDLFPIIDITKKLCSTFVLQLHETINMHIKIHEDNIGALALGKLEPR